MKCFEIIFDISLILISPILHSDGTLSLKYSIPKVPVETFKEYQFPDGKADHDIEISQEVQI